MEKKGMELLNELLNAVQATRPEVAKASGVPYYTLAKLADGSRKIKPANAVKLAEYFSRSLVKEISARDLLSDDEDDVATVRKVPVYRYSSSGDWRLEEAYQVESEEVLIPDYTNAELFMLDMTDDLVWGGQLYKRRLILFKRCETVESGKAALVSYKGKLILRVVKWDEGKALLLPITAGVDMHVDIASPGEMSILGQAIRVEATL